MLQIKSGVISVEQTQLFDWSSITNARRVALWVVIVLSFSGSLYWEPAESGSQQAVGRRGWIPARLCQHADETITGNPTHPLCVQWSSTLDRCYEFLHLVSTEQFFMLATNFHLGFVQDSSQIELLKQLMDLQKDMVVMMLSLLEGRHFFVSL